MILCGLFFLLFSPDGIHGRGQARDSILWRVFGALCRGATSGFFVVFEVIFLFLGGETGRGVQGRID